MGIDLLQKVIKIVKSGGGRLTIAKELGVSRWKSAQLIATAKFLIDNGLEDIIRFEAKLRQTEEALKLYKRKYKKALHLLGLQDELLNVVRDILEPLQPPPPVEYNFKDTKEKSVENITLLLSDFHANEVVNSREMHGINSYNIDEFILRLSRVLGSVVNIAKNKLKGYVFEALNIDLLGDFISGGIHKELELTNSPDDIRAVLLVALVLAQGISALSKHFPKVYVRGVVGNHGRVSKDVMYKRIAVNYDYLIYKILEILLAKHKNVEFDIPESWFLIYENRGHHICMFHGDGIRMYYSVPFYGVIRTVEQLSKLIRKELGVEIDIWEMGHFHQPVYLPDNIILNGSLIGANEFSIKKLRSGIRPFQKMYGMHNRGISFMFNLDPLYNSKHVLPLTKPNLEDISGWLYSSGVDNDNSNS